MEGVQGPEVVKALCLSYGIRLFAACVIVAFLLRTARATPDDLGLRLRGFGADAAWSAKTIAVLLVASLVLIAAAIAVLRLGGWRVAPPREAWMWPVGLIAAPIQEELVYRSLVVPGLAAGWGRRGAVVLSGAIFYLLHLVYDARWWQVHYVVAGMILSWAFLARGRLWICVLLHAGGNFMVMLDDVLLWLSPDLYRRLLGQ